MDKKIILLPLLFAFQIVTAQEVRFSERAFDNGLNYPVVDFSGNVDAKNALNENILEIVSKYENQEFCIGEYGFVQRTSFIQLNFYFNCIDMEVSKSESHLFDLSSGEICPPSTMFLKKEEKKYHAFLHKKISAHYVQNGKEVPTNEFLSKLSIDDCNVTLLEEGIEVSINAKEDWPENDLLIKWGELRPFLKTIFI